MTKPLKWVWAGYAGSIGGWHAIAVEDILKALDRSVGRGCFNPETRNFIDNAVLDCKSMAITADTPDEKDCCKKCWRKVKDES